MIYSNLNTGDSLAVYPAAVRRALAWLKSTDVTAMEPGTVELEGRDIYAMVQDVTTHPVEGSWPEVHRDYVDLMYWPEAGERIGVAHFMGDEPVHEARPASDVYFLEHVAGENILATVPGDFCLLFPWDAHRPALHPAGEPVTFRKVVMKIAVKCL